MTTGLTRRGVLKGGVGLAGLAAASSVVGFSSKAWAAGNLEVFSWWTSGGEAAAKQELFDGYSRMFPGTSLVDAAVAGGSGSNALPVLQARLAGGNPPDSWQSNTGVAFRQSYVDPGFVADLTELYSTEGWLDKIPQAVIDLVSKDGKIYAMQVGAHRCNEVWYNKKLLAQHGVEIGKSLSFDEFFAAADKLKAAGVNALAIGDNGIWANYRMLENTINGVLGLENTRKLWAGELAFNAPEAKEAYAIHSRMLDYQNADHSALSWDQAVGKVIRGELGFNMMGDWAYGEFAKAGAKDGEDFGWVSHPGTDDIFVIVTDCFPIANTAPNPTEAVNWLKAIGSADVQLAFSKKKGCVAPRLDIDRSSLPLYLQWSYNKFATNQFSGSNTNGTDVSPAFVQASMDALTTFAVSRDVDAFAEALTAAAPSLQS